ncbi:MAG: mechanosensitive ion channel family protein [Cytophagales bacterium]|nr:mechanosensitive ion channel family protein [Cytophaga sp.]
MHINVEEIYQKGFSWILDHGPGVILAVVVFAIGQWIIKFIRNWLRNSLSKRNVNASLAPFIQSLFITALQVVLILIVMQIMGLQMTIFAAGVASFGVAIGLALSGTLQNFAGGILILLLKPFKVGDNIVAQGQDGIVSSIQIFYTVVTTFDNKTVIIPNSKLSNEVIVNMSQEGKRRLDIEVKFPYTADAAQIQDIIIKTIASTDEIMKDPQPRTGVSSLDPDGFIVIVEVWIDALKYYDIRNDFQQKVLKAFKEAALK